MKEIWKPIEDYEGYYEVSNFGNIRSVSHVVSGPVNGGHRTYSTKSSVLKQYVSKLEWCSHKHNSNWGTNPERVSLRQNKTHSRHRKVFQYTMDGKFIKTFYAASHAAKELGVDSSWIIACCRGTKCAKSAGGFIFKYADE